MRLPALVLVLLLAIWAVDVSAYHPEATTSVSMTITQDIVVSPIDPTFVLTIRYPNGGSRLYDGDRIPSSISVPVGSWVELKVFARFGEKGTYIAKSRSYVLTDLPRDVANDVVEASSFSSVSNTTGNIQSAARASIRQYYEGLSVLLQVSLTSSTVQGSNTFAKTVVVSCNPPVTMMTLVSSTSTSSTHTRSSRSSASSARESLTSSSTSPGKSTAARTSMEGQAASGLSVSPHSMEVEAGDVASFDLCVGSSSPTFSLEGLPTGYRYVITSSGDCYKLRIFTHPMSYGRFDMTVVVKSGNAEERRGISLTVRKAQPQSSSTSSSPLPTTSTQMRNTPEQSQSPQTGEQAAATPSTVVTVVTVVKEEPSTGLLAIGGLAGLLGLLLVVALLKRR